MKLEKKSLQSILNNGNIRNSKNCCSHETELENPRDGMGHLPAKAPLANAYVPFQSNDPQKYMPGKALIRGTLFPGLDLPYLGMVNQVEKGNSGLPELQALAFAIQELGLYLNTHKEDKEAVELFSSYSELYRNGLEIYQKKHGPLKQMYAVCNDKYLWTNGPWPWEYAANQCREG